jgi:hypothetical protein
MIRERDALDDQATRLETELDEISAAWPIGTTESWPEPLRQAVSRRCTGQAESSLLNALGWRIMFRANLLYRIPGICVASNDLSPAQALDHAREFLIVACELSGEVPVSERRATLATQVRWLFRTKRTKADDCDLIERAAIWLWAWADRGYSIVASW